MYHSSPVEIKEIKSGLYGPGLFFASSVCKSGAFVYELDADEIKSCSANHLRYEFDDTETEVVAFAEKWEIDSETAFDIITEKENSYDHIEDGLSAGYAGWEAQKIALVLAMRAGFEAVGLTDENGGVMLVDGNAAMKKWRLVE